MSSLAFRRHHKAIVLSIILIAGLIAATSITSEAADGSDTRRCGDAGPVRGFTAKGVRARGINCRRARRVARRYLRSEAVRPVSPGVRGWRCTTRRSGRRACTRKCLVVSFRVQGTGVPE